ncbi:unnamed protein product [Sphagnum troendelagicum]
MIQEISKPLSPVADYLNDMQVLDLKTLEWSKMDKVPQSPLSLQQKQSPYRYPPCAGHSLVWWTTKLLAVAGHSKEPVDTVIGVATPSGCTLMVWSQPQTQGTVPSPCARHAGATIGISDTLVLNMDTLVWSLVASVKGQTAISSEGLSVAVVEDSLVAFGGYNGHFKNQIQKNLSESVQENFDVEQLREEPECALDNSATSKKLALALKVSEELQEATLAAQAECSKLQSELAMAQFSSSELEQELHSVHGQLAAEQSRSFCLEVDVAELRQKLQCMEILQWELDLLQCQKDASKEAVIQAAQKQGTGVWSWLAGSPPDSDRVED